MAGADRLADADLAGALGDGHEHDVHHTDAADEQQIAATAPSSTVNVRLLLCSVCSSDAWLRTLKSSRWTRVLREEDRRDFGLRGRVVFELVAWTVRVSTVPVLPKRVAHGRQREDRDVVLILEAVRALRLQDADDRERLAAEATCWPTRRNRRPVAEQVLHDGEADHRDVGVSVVLVLGELRSPLHRVVAHDEKFVVVPETCSACRSHRCRRRSRRWR